MTRGTLLDANLLCLLVVARLGAKAVQDHPRLQTFTSSDVNILAAVFARRGDPILCAPVIAETSNLLAFRQSPQQIVRLRAALAAIVRECAEYTSTATLAVDDPSYARLGFADAVMLLLAANSGASLVSDDLDLCLEAARRGYQTINYNHLRDGGVRIDQL